MTISPYPTGSGSVDRPASRDQEQSFDNGLPPRLTLVLSRVAASGNYGATWKEVANDLGLHHGQASSALSNLHALGHIFAMRDRRERSHIYIAARHRGMYAADEVYDEPVRTMAARRREATEDVIFAARQHTRHPDYNTLIMLREALATLEGLTP